mmetsp:Transcript_24358/g.36134  ORF Transcript_24358/g.36134 Transcript_24358/m.36134 type:complete len:193 (-) Transcript_24358:79-657(-)
MSKLIASSSLRWLVRNQATALTRNVGAAPFSSLSPPPSDNENYVSPFKDLFEKIKNNDDFGIPDLVEKDPKYLECGVREDALRFETVNYGRLQLPPHIQPWEHRVKLRVDIDDIPLETELERQIFEEIVGVRLKNDVLQISSNLFGSRIENYRHLTSMLNRTVLGAKRLANEMAKEAQQASADTSLEKEIEN